MGYHQQYYGDKCTPAASRNRPEYKTKLIKPLNLGLPPMKPRQFTPAEIMAAFKAYKILPEHAEEQVNALKNIYRRAVEYNDAYAPKQKAEIKRYVDLLEGIVKYPYSTIAETGSGHRAH